jgi:predicted enzyme related to lactoylglutathione lyase
MKIEKIDRVVIHVKDLAKAVGFFSDLFGTTFDEYADRIMRGEVKRERVLTEYADPSFEERGLKVAHSPIGLELIEATPAVEKEGIRSIVLKVPDLEEAKAEMKKKGIRLLLQVKLGGLKEAIFHPDDLHGVRLCLAEYETSTVIEAILQKL